MAELSERQVTEYLRLLALPELAGPLRVRPEPAAFDGLRFAVETERARYLLKRYDPAAAEEARREAAGLRLGGGIGLAPALLRADEDIRALGGPVVLVEDVGRATLAVERLDDAALHDWLFLLLTLYHLPPETVAVTSSMSADALAWWQRSQPAWDACKARYAGSRYAPLLGALTQLHVITSVHLEAHEDLWAAAPRRPCHGNPVPAHVARAHDHLVLTEWGGFGLGDPALEVARVAGLAALTGELSGEQYRTFLAQFAGGMRDARDETLRQRMDVFASVLPLGFCFIALGLLAGQHGKERARTLEQLARALQWAQNALGVRIGDPAELLRPLSQP
jgi:hypothetical protein